MVTRSLKACSEGISEAERALTNKGWSREDLAGRVVLEGKKTTYGISILTVHNFFTGKAVDRKYFVGLCTVLDLAWEKVAGMVKQPETVLVNQNDDQGDDLDRLVQQIRLKIYADIQQRCGTMRVLDMRQPVGLSDIYTDVNILETITGRRRLGITELLQNFDPESDNFERRGLGNISEERVPGLRVVDKYPKLMVLGKPGAGKTTFLKYIAVQSTWGEFQPGRVPIFITLKDFSESEENQDLLKYISQILVSCQVSHDETIRILENGRAIVLLDGLDEVREEDSRRVLKQIQKFSDRFFLSNQFSHDQRSTVQERQDSLANIKEHESKLKNILKNLEERRNELEIQSAKMDKRNAELKEMLKKPSLEEGDYKYEILRLQEDREVVNQEQLRNRAEEILLRKEYLKIQEVYIALDNEFPDILRHPDQGLGFLSQKFSERFYNNHFVITCRIAAREYTFEKFVEVEVADFDDNQIQSFSQNWFKLKNPDKGSRFTQKLLENQPVKELASSPLLLTLLCLVFEESADFPLNRSQLYKEGASILLKKWDGQRDIERDQIYQDLSSPRKEDLLSQIAWTTFQRKDYFFRQREAELYISEYIRNLPGAKTDSETLRLDSEAVLKSIEAQHGLLMERAKGIYSFSHLTFQEYFAARKIVTTSDPLALADGLQLLVNHITERRWIEVFLLAVGMLPNADYLLRLMKQKSDALLANDQAIQNFLSFLNKKTTLIDFPYTQVSIRAIYFAATSDKTLAISLARSRTSSTYRKLANELLVVIMSVRDCSTELVSILTSERKSETTYTHSRFLQLIRQLDLTINLAHSLTNELILSLDQDFQNFRTTNLNLVHSLSPELTNVQTLATVLNAEGCQMLQKLREQLPAIDTGKKDLKLWWQTNGQSWIKSLSEILFKYKNPEQEWRLTEDQRQTLKLYCDANKLIVDCLKSDCYIEHETRQEIESTLLLPYSEIEKRKQK